MRFLTIFLFIITMFYGLPSAQAHQVCSGLVTNPLDCGGGGSGGGSVSFGAVNEIPITNSSTDDFDYDPDLNWDSVNNRLNAGMFNIPEDAYYSFDNMTNGTGMKWASDFGEDHITFDDANNMLIGLFRTTVMGAMFDRNKGIWWVNQNSRYSTRDVGLLSPSAGLLRIVDSGTTNRRDLELRDLNVEGDIVFEDGSDTLTMSYSSDKLSMANNSTFDQFEFSGNSTFRIEADASPKVTPVSGAWLLGESGFEWSEVWSDSYRMTIQDEDPTDTGDGNPQTLTLNPANSVVRITCVDADSTDVTMGESDTDVREVVIYNDGAQVCDFADSAGVSELAGAFAMGTNDSLKLLYTG
jgi:hypothetical protein